MSIEAGDGEFILEEKEGLKSDGGDDKDLTYECG